LNALGSTELERSTIRQVDGQNPTHMPSKADPEEQVRFGREGSAFASHRNGIGPGTVGSVGSVGLRPTKHARRVTVR